MNITNNLEYKPQLDALRAIAVLAVMVHHFLPVERYIPDDFITLGLLGVRLFFVLSGYLITGILLNYRKYNLQTILKRFYVRRALRIFPIYYLTLTVLLLLGVASVKQYSYWYYFYFSNFLFVLHPGPTAQTGHLWSLSVEEQFYLIWPFLICLVPYKYLSKLIIGVISIGIIWKTFIAIRFGANLAGAFLPFSCLDSLGFGALLAFFERDYRLKNYRGIFLRAALIVGITIVLVQTILYIRPLAKVVSVP